MKVAPTLVSETEFLALPETLERMELLDGEVILAPSPTFWHQELVARVTLALRRWAETQPSPVCIGQSPMDVRFGQGRILQPDTFVILGAVDRDHVGPIDRVPEICVEVLSSNRAYDRLTKRLVYGESGVAEYWILDPAGSVERWHGPGLAERESVDRTLRSPLLAGFALELSPLFT